MPPQAGYLAASIAPRMGGYEAEAPGGLGASDVQVCYVARLIPDWN